MMRTNHAAAWTAPHVDTHRLETRMEALAFMGTVEEPGHGLSGVRRIALTKSELAARKLLQVWLDEHDLIVSRDAVGNMFATRPGLNNGLAPVIVGAHLDAVSNSHRRDSGLGVAAALEVLASLEEHNMETRRPVTAAFFLDSEGARWGSYLLGSSVAAGALDVDEALDKLDRHGVSLREELENTQLSGTTNLLHASPPYAYVECAPDQTSALSTAGFRMGAVAAVRAVSAWKISIKGTTDSAARPSMIERHDAGLVMALVRSRMHALSTTIPGLTCTFGLMRTLPGVAGLIPGIAEFTVDLRHASEDELCRAEDSFMSILDESADLAHCEVSSRTQTNRTTSVDMSYDISEAIEREAWSLGIETTEVVSPTLYDAQEMTSITRSGVLLVRSGMHPGESASITDCSDATQVLCRVVCSLAD